MDQFEYVMVLVSIIFGLMANGLDVLDSYLKGVRPRMSASPADIDEDLFSALRSLFSDKQIVELASAIAWESYRARFNRVFPWEPSSGPLVFFLEELQVPVEGEHAVGLSAGGLPEDSHFFQRVRQSVRGRLRELRDLGDPWPLTRRG